MSFIDTICEKLSLNELEKVKIIKDLSEKAKIKPAYLGLIVIGLVTMFVIFEYGAYWIAFGVGFMYPAYMSYKSLETTDTADDKLWLTYWVVFSCINVFDKFISMVLSLIPAYNFFKIVLYVWLFHPKTKGAKTIYEKALRPLLKKYEGYIDTQLEKLTQAAKNAAPAVANLTKEARNEIVHRAVDQAMATKLD